MGSQLLSALCPRCNQIRVLILPPPSPCYPSGRRDCFVWGGAGGGGPPIPARNGMGGSNFLVGLSWAFVAGSARDAPAAVAGSRGGGAPIGCHGAVEMSTASLHGRGTIASSLRGRDGAGLAARGAGEEY